MAVIHHTTLTPSKLELLTSWLPSQPWFVGGAGEPQLAKAGGFRLDDPAGEVGIEFMVVTDTSSAEPTTYFVPLTYRGAPLEGAERALVGNMEHGVLGQRWAYDGCHDPVLVAQVLALIEGRVQAQAQSISDALDPDVVRAYVGDGPVGADFAGAVDGPESTELTAPSGAVLRFQRVLRPAPDGGLVVPPEAAGHVAGKWRAPDDSDARGVFVVLDS